MKYKWLLFIAFLLGTFTSNAFQDTSSIGKMQTLEKRVKALEDSLRSQQDNYEDIKNAAKLASDFVKKPVATVIKYASIITGLSLALLLLFVALLKQANPKWFTNIIQGWVEKYEEVNRLKQEKSILVLSANQDFANQKFIKKLFDKRKFGFHKVEYATLENMEEKLKTFDPNIIFANNEDGKLNQTTLEKLIEKRYYTALFYFGKPNSWDFRKYDQSNPTEFLDRLNFANSRAQVYGNLLSTMKFHDTLI